MNKYDAPFLASSGHVAQEDTSKCDACGKCEKTCPFGAVKVEKTSTVQWGKCMGCGACVSQCSSEAMSLARDEKKGPPFDVRAMA